MKQWKKERKKSPNFIFPALKEKEKKKQEKVLLFDTSWVILGVYYSSSVLVNKYKLSINKYK